MQSVGLSLKTQKFPPVLAAASISTVLIAALLTMRGVSITPDSATYLVTARNLVEGRGYLGFDGRHMVSFPPGYPVALAAAMILGGLSPEGAAIAISIVCIFASVFGFGSILTELVRGKSTRAWIFVGSCVFGLSFSMIQATTTAWSEPLFLVLIIWAAALQISPKIPSRRRGLLIGLLLGAAVLTHTAGVFAVMAALIIFLMRRQYKWAGYVGLMGFLPAISWSLVNTYQAGSSTVQRGVSADGVVEVVGRGLATMVQWFSPGIGPIVIQALAGILIGGLIVGVAVLGFRDWKCLLVPAIYFVVLAACTFGTRILVAMDDLGPRLLIPLLPFAPLCVITTLARNKYKKIAILAAGLMIVATSAATIAQESEKADTLAFNEIVADSCKFIPSGLVVSNAPAILAYECDRTAIPAPRSHLYESSITLDELPALRALMQVECISLSYFHQLAGDYYLKWSEIQSGASMQTLAYEEKFSIATSC